MPNDVTTRCTVTGPAKDMQRFRTTIICVPFQQTEATLDFNRVIPMPEVIKITTCSSDEALGIEILSGTPKTGVFSRSYLDIPWVQELGIDSITELPAWAEKERTVALVEGELAIEAHSQTGFYDWYDWSVANWGTKWNGYNFDIDYDDDERISFRFDTAWSFPTPIFAKLAEMFPALRFECVCFDEGWIFAGEGTFNGDPPFRIVEATDELFEAVYGFKPVYEDESSEPALATE